MKHYRIFLFLLVLVSSGSAQDATSTNNPLPAWNGDPLICIPNNSTPSATDPPYPQFPTKAEFTLEVAISGHLGDQGLPTSLVRMHYLYDYDANRLVLITNTGNRIDLEYYYYKQQLKSTYIRGDSCVVSPIACDVENDGKTAICVQGQEAHIRPLAEFLLFYRIDSRKPKIIPKFLQQTVIRGVTVNQWETCIVDPINFTTEKRIWSFATPNVVDPSDSNPIGTRALPIQAEIRQSKDLRNGTQLLELDTTFSVHTYRSGIIEAFDQLSPPKGVFCSSGANQTLGSLEDFRVNWPERFSVRVEASSSRSGQWQRFHLRYDRGRQRGGRIIRYDYLPPGGEDYRSIIHDYALNITYSIDLQTGGCQIRRSLDLPDVSPIRDPVEFFIKHEDVFILNRRGKVWESNGYRPCRGNTIDCTILTAQYPNFPVMVESDTDKPNGDTWSATNMEYAWSIRAPLGAQGGVNGTRGLDYPAHLYLRFYLNDPNSGSIPTFRRNEDLEYEFFELAEDGNPYDFDVSTCYRSNGYEYLHLGFVLTLSQGDVAEGNHLDRIALRRALIMQLTRIMMVNYPRISGLEIDHEAVTNEVTAFFSLLSPAPGIVTTEPSVNVSRNTLEGAINDGTLKFTIPLTDNSSKQLEFTAKKNSLKSSGQFMSIHAAGKKVVEKSYSKSAEALAIIFGSVIGLLVGILIAVAARIIRKEPIPKIPGIQTSMSNPLPNISFHNKKPPTEETKTTTDA